MSAPIVTAEHVSKWYGQVIGLNDVTVERAARHHRAARPERRRQVDVHEADHRSAQAEQGPVKVLGEPIWRNPHLYFQIGFCPEQDAFYERMTGLEWVTALVRLNGLGDKEADEAARAAR